MKHRRLIYKLAFLTKEEMAEYAKFCQFYWSDKSDIYNNAIIILQSYLPNIIEEYDEIKFHDAIYAKQEYNINRTNKLFTHLAKAFDMYIVYKQSTLNPFDEVKSKIAFYKSKNDHKSITEEIAILQELISSSPIKNEKYFLNSYQLNEINFSNIFNKDPRKGDLQLQTMIDSFDKYYIFRKLEFYCMVLSRKAMFNVDFNSYFMDQLLEELPNSIFIKDPHIKILFEYILLFQNPTAEAYYNFINIFKKTIILLSPQDQKGYYTLIENICPKIFKDNVLAEKLFELYEIQIESKVILQNQLIQPTLYNNIVTIALRLNKLDWADNFIELYKSNIDPEFYNDYYTYNKARLLFAKNKLDMIHPLINKMDYNNAEIKLAVKRLLTKTYFVLKEFELLEYNLKTIKIFIFRNEDLSSVHIDMHKTYLKYINKFIGVVQNPNKQKVDKLVIEINNIPNLIDKSWITTHLNQLKTI